MDQQMSETWRAIVLIIGHIVYGVWTFGICAARGINNLWYMLGIYGAYMFLNFVVLAIYLSAERSRERRFNQKCLDSKDYVGAYLNRDRNIFISIVNLILMIIFFPALYCCLPYIRTDRLRREARECYKEHSQYSRERDDYYYDNEGRRQIHFHCGFADKSTCSAYTCCYFCEKTEEIVNEEIRKRNWG